MKKRKVLFICTHNSARSQMAEGWLNALFGDRFEAKSAGLEPGDLNPLAVTAMDEVGIDISQSRTKKVQDFLKAGESFSWIITVCDEASGEHRPFFSGNANCLHWSFPDPELLGGTLEDRMNAMRTIRGDIGTAVRKWGTFLGL
jgi:arsenate reductase